MSEDSTRDDGSTPEGPSWTTPNESEDSPELKVVDRRWWARQAAGEALDDSGDERRSSKPTYVEELERQLADRDELLAATRAKYKEASNEFDEARVRLRRELAKDAERSRRTALAEFLDVLDNLERALEAARGSSSVEALLQGVEMVRDQFMGKLGDIGIRRIASIGEPFDPACHEAVSTVPTDDPAKDGTVVGVITEGYLIGDEVLRAATVAVAKWSDSS